ncbi:MAG TPA: endonuclease/exonuclease/phosphatase family protein [Chitinophagaceae bacterium]
MKYVLLLLILPVVLPVRGQQHLNVMSFNIRYDTPRDSANAWPLRKDYAAGQILFHEAHIVGVQEALHHQLTDLKERLTNYNYVGVGRDDGRQKGEYSAIFYDSTRLKVLESRTFWLSPTPDVPGSKGWDAAITRIVTWAKFRDLRTKKQFFVFNTHFDHIGQVARAESAKLLINYVRDVAGNAPCIITGDFNAHPGQEPIQIITNNNDPLHLIDSKAVSASQHYGPGGTFNGFQSKESSDAPIDHIFIKNKVKVQQHATLSQTWGGRFSSDHFPVFARVVVQ